MNKRRIIPAVLITVFILASLSFFSRAEDFCSLETLSCNGTGANLNASSSNLTGEEGLFCIYFFYGDGCPSCAKIEPLIKELADKYPQVNVKYFQVYFNETNTNMLNDFNSRYAIERPGIPSVFIGDRAFIGDKAIRNNLESSIQEFMNNTPVCPEEYKKQEPNFHDISPIKKTELTVPAILTAAVIDSINPCAFSVLIFLLVYLMGLGAKKRILKVGITYIATVFVVYFFSGLGLMRLIQTPVLAKIVPTFAAIVAIAAGLINVKDFFFYGKGITLAIPESKKPLLQRYIQKASVPAAIILGVLVSMFELPCTGGVYLAILSLLSSAKNLAIPYLLLYNLIFVLPLFIILGIVYKGIPPEKVEHWRLSERKWMRLAMGTAMIALGVIMLLGII
jgi:cytochrome c biogenesis protein CcdA